MSNWRPSSGPAAAGRRAALLERARQYFSARGVLSVDVPALNRYAISDPNIESLAVRMTGGSDAYLHTSPEFSMKQLLAAGYPDIYSICRVFRGSELGRHHLPEFTMVEWYRLDFELKSIIDDTTRFIAACLDDESILVDVRQHEYADAFRDFANIDVSEASTDELDMALSTVVAPQFPAGKLTVLRHYPADQAALARICPNDPQVADRFEVFFGSLELANGYVELTDAAEQQRRMLGDLETRQQKSRAKNPIDKNLIAALESGLPPCAGVAIGVERLQMVLDQVDDIASVVTFTSTMS